MTFFGLPKKHALLAALVFSPHFSAKRLPVSPEEEAHIDSASTGVPSDGSSYGPSDFGYESASETGDFPCRLLEAGLYTSGLDDCGGAVLYEAAKLQVEARAEKLQETVLKTLPASPATVEHLVVGRAIGGVHLYAGMYRDSLKNGNWNLQNLPPVLVVGDGFGNWNNMDYTLAQTHALLETPHLTKQALDFAQIKDPRRHVNARHLHRAVVTTAADLQMPALTARVVKVVPKEDWTMKTEVPIVRADLVGECFPASKMPSEWPEFAVLLSIGTESISKVVCVQRRIDVAAGLGTARVNQGLKKYIDANGKNKHERTMYSNFKDGGDGESPASNAEAIMDGNKFMLGDNKMKGETKITNPAIQKDAENGRPTILVIGSGGNATANVRKAVLGSDRDGEIALEKLLDETRKVPMSRNIRVDSEAFSSDLPRPEGHENPLGSRGRVAIDPEAKKLNNDSALNANVIWVMRDKDSSMAGYGKIARQVLQAVPEENMHYNRHLVGVKYDQNRKTWVAQFVTHYNDKELRPRGEENREEYKLNDGKKWESKDHPMDLLPKSDRPKVILEVEFDQLVASSGQDGSALKGIFACKSFGDEVIVTAKQSSGNLVLRRDLLAKRIEGNLNKCETCDAVGDYGMVVGAGFSKNKNILWHGAMATSVWQFSVYLRHWDLRNGRATADGEWPGVMPPSLASQRVFFATASQKPDDVFYPGFTSTTGRHAAAFQPTSVNLNVDYRGFVEHWLNAQGRKHPALPGSAGTVWSEWLQQKRMEWNSTPAEGDDGGESVGATIPLHPAGWDQNGIDEVLASMRLDRAVCLARARDTFIGTVEVFEGTACGKSQKQEDGSSSESAYAVFWIILATTVLLTVTVTTVWLVICWCSADPRG